MGRGEWRTRILKDSLVYHAESDSPSRSLVRKPILRHEDEGESGLGLLMEFLNGWKSDANMGRSLSLNRGSRRTIALGNDEGLDSCSAGIDLRRRK